MRKRRSAHVNSGPGSPPLAAMSSAVTGQSASPVVPMCTVNPCRKGSVFDALIWTLSAEGAERSSTATSEKARCASKSKEDSVGRTISPERPQHHRVTGDRFPNHLRPPKIASGGTLTFNGLRPRGRICPSNFVRGDGIHYAITSYAIELRSPPTYLRLRG